MKLSKSFIAAVFFFTLVGMTFSAKAQDNATKLEVQQNRKAIMMQMNQKSVPDSLTIQVMDTATANAWWERLQQTRQKGASVSRSAVNSARFFKKLQTSGGSSFQPPPVRIRTQSKSGNSVIVFIENTTDRPLSRLSVSVDELPEGWSAEPNEITAEVLEPGQQESFTFALKGGFTSEHLGFSFKAGQELAIAWSARVKLAEHSNELLPSEFEIHGSYPNPFQGSTTLSYSLPEPMEMEIEIYNILGQKVATMVSSKQEAGTQHMTWDASGMASGIYICRIIAKKENGEQIVEEQKMMLIK